MRKLSYVALAAFFALLVSACHKDQTKGILSEDLQDERHLNFFHMRVIEPGEVVDLMPIDSNTAVIKPDGDTVFPRWYQQKISKASGARQMGIMSTAYGYEASIEPPLKTAATSRQFMILGHYVHQYADVYIKSNNDFEYPVGRFYPSSPGASIVVNVNIPVSCGNYYMPVIHTFQSNDPEDQIIHTSKEAYYNYSFQQYLGQGTAYGADMKMLNFEGYHTGTELLSVIANRSSGGINGISYLIYKALDKNGNVTGGHTGLRTLQMQASSSAPKGVAAALANLDHINPFDQNNDMVLATYTKLNNESAYSIKYMVGLNISTSTGLPATWLNQPSSPLTVAGFGNDVVDIGAGIADFNGDGNLDLMFMGFTANSIWYRVGYTLNTTTGNADWSQPAKLLWTKDWNILGGGMDARGGNIVISVYRNPYGAQTFMTGVYDWNASTQSFNPTPKTEYQRQTVGAATAGAGVAIGYFDANNTTYDILSMAYVGNDFRYIVDFNYSYENWGQPRFWRGLCGARTN